MPKKPKIILILFFLALASCNRGHNPAQKQEISAAEYEVLSAWLGQKITPEARKNGLTQIVIYDTTDSDDDHLLRDDHGRVAGGPLLQYKTRGCPISRVFCEKWGFQTGKHRSCRADFIFTVDQSFTTTIGCPILSRFVRKEMGTKGV